jgi:EAL domain-containing protein (putative c-di-GMP-specific phosphodiesterase class I)
VSTAAAKLDRVLIESGHALPEISGLQLSARGSGGLGNLRAALAKDSMRIAVKRIETSVQLAVARDAGVGWVQGFLLDAPGIVGGLAATH